MSSTPAWVPRDPRWLQIIILSSLLLWGVAVLNLPVSPLQVGATLGGALTAQWVGSRAVRLPRFDPKSAIITALGLSILLRTNAPELGALAGFIAIGAKFCIRVNGKHLFNPAMFYLLTPGT